MHELPQPLHDHHQQLKHQTYKNNNKYKYIFLVVFIKECIFCLYLPVRLSAHMFGIVDK
jgi:hypothetical protein